MATFSAYGKKDSMNNFRTLIKATSKSNALAIAEEYYDTWVHEDIIQVPSGGLAGLFGETDRKTIKRASCISVIVSNDDDGSTVWAASNG